MRAMIGLAPIFLAMACLTGCGNEDHKNIFHSTFTADGVAKDFTTRTGFIDLLCTNSAKYCIFYNLDDNDSSHNMVYLGLPKDAAVNMTYNQNSDHVSFIYWDGNGGSFSWRPDRSRGFNIGVTRWEGMGGYAGGWFGGTLTLDEVPTQTLTIQDGRFEGFIIN